MFKHYFHFAQHDPADHPGQPVHSDAGFDVWRKAADFILHPLWGDPLKFPSLQGAIDHARAALAAGPLPAAQPAPEPPAEAPVPGVPVTTVTVSEPLKT